MQHEHSFRHRYVSQRLLVDLGPMIATCPVAAHLIVRDGYVTFAACRLRIKAFDTIKTKGQRACLLDVYSHASHEEGEW